MEENITIVMGMLALEFKNKKIKILGHTQHYIPGHTNVILWDMEMSAGYHQLPHGMRQRTKKKTIF